MASRISLNTSYILLTLVLITGVVFGVVLLRPLINNIMQVRSEIAVTREEISAQQEFLATLDRRLIELQQQQQHEQQLAVILPTDAREEDTLRILHEASSVSGGTIQRITNQSVSAQADYNSQVARGDRDHLPAGILPLSWTIEFAGTYQQFRAFLQELEKSVRLMDVQDIRLSSSAQEGSQNISASVSVTFYKHQPASTLTENTNPL